MCRSLAAAVLVGIKGQIDGSRTVAELPELACIEIGAHRAGDVVKAGLPQRGVVEQALDENHFRMSPDLVPCVQATFGARQKTMRRRCSREAAAIEIAFQRKDDAMDVGVVAGAGDQAGLAQSLERVAQLRQPTPQAATGRVADPHVLDQFRRADSALIADRQLPRCDGVTACDRNLRLPASSGARPRHWRSSAKRLRELHLVIEFGKANHVAAAATAVAVEQVFVGVHQKARLVIGVQRTQSHPVDHG